MLISILKKKISMDRDRYIKSQDFRDGYDEGIKDATNVEMNDILALKEFINVGFEQIDARLNEKLERYISGEGGKKE